MDSTLAPARTDRSFFALNAIVSAAALALLFYILELHRGSAQADAQLAFMPAVNATLNAISATCLTCGYVAVRRRAISVHRAFMMGAFAASALFLVVYLSYHFVHGDTRYVGHGWVRGLYLSILASHVLLSMTILPLALTTFWFALGRKFVKHKRIARWTLPIWLYVSITGVVIFFMLRVSRAS